LDRRPKDLQRILIRALLNQIECAVANAFSCALLPLFHEGIDELAEQLVVVPGIGCRLPGNDTAPPRHLSVSSPWLSRGSRLLLLGAVLGRALAPVVDPHRIERTAHQMIADTGQILDAPAPYTLHVVLL